MRTLTLWPTLAAGVLIQVWLVRRVRRTGRFRVPWIVSAALLAAGLSAALWAQSFLSTQLTYQTVGEGARANMREELQRHLSQAWPFLVPLGAVLLALVKRPRSNAAITALVAAAGVLVSWIVGMWLNAANHHEAVFRLLLLPGGAGVVASMIGFSTATALWMAIGRWIWKQGRRRRSRGITSHADGNLPQLRG